MDDSREDAQRSEMLAWAQEEVAASINAATPELAELHRTLANVIRECVATCDLADGLASGSAPARLLALFFNRSFAADAGDELAGRSIA